MSLKKFDDNDVFINTLEANPEYSFFIITGSVYINNQSHLDETTGVPAGFESLYGLRRTESPSGSHIFPFIPKSANKMSFKIFRDFEHNILFQGGELIKGNYNMTSSIKHYYYQFQNVVGNVDSRITSGYRFYEPSGDVDHNVHFSIQNVLSKYTFLSPHFKMITEAPMPVRDLRGAEMAVIDIPSIFYGDKIKKGSLELNYFVTGTLIGTLKDEKQNGELIMTGPLGFPGSGSVKGLALYTEGILLLTGSDQIGHADNNIDYIDSSDTINKWTHFASGLHEDQSSVASMLSASFELKYQGTSTKQTMMLMAHANYGEMNWSNNPTFVDQQSPYIGTFSTGSKFYYENDVNIANKADTTLAEYVPEFKRETYITKVAVYDDKKNLIGVASVANPVRKTEERQYTFKLKLDL